MKETITYTVYKPAPESAKFYLNGKIIEIPCEYNAGYYATIGDRKQAIDRAKQYIRKERKKNNIQFITYGYYLKNTNQYVWINQLKANPDDLHEKLYCYKEAKKYFEKNPYQIVIESGNIVPGEKSEKEVKKEKIEIDFKRPIIIKFTA